MNREYIFDYGRAEERWSLTESLSKWTWSVICCGVPGIPCSYCSCCRNNIEEEPVTVAINDTESLPVATCERELTHRPHALRGRKSTPELMSAVKFALTELQGQPAPLTPDLKNANKKTPNTNAPETDAPEDKAKQDSKKKDETGRVQDGST